MSEKRFGGSWRLLGSTFCVYGILEAVSERLKGSWRRNCCSWSSSNVVAVVVGRRLSVAILTVKEGVVAPQSPAVRQWAGESERGRVRESQMRVINNIVLYLAAQVSSTPAAAA